MCYCILFVKGRHEDNAASGDLPRPGTHGRISYRLSEREGRERSQKTAQSMFQMVLIIVHNARASVFTVKHLIPEDRLNNIFTLHYIKIQPCIKRFDKTFLFKIFLRYDMI